MLQLVDLLTMKGRKAGEMRLRQRLESLLPGSAEALQKQYSVQCKISRFSDHCSCAVGSAEVSCS